MSNCFAKYSSSSFACSSAAFVLLSAACNCNWNALDSAANESSNTFCLAAASSFIIYLAHL
jgi:hypothetical protein